MLAPATSKLPIPVRSSKSPARQVNFDSAAIVPPTWLARFAAAAIVLTDGRCRVAMFCLYLGHIADRCLGGVRRKNPFQKVEQKVARRPRRRRGATSIPEQTMATNLPAVGQRQKHSMLLAQWQMAPFGGEASIFHHCWGGVQYLLGTMRIFLERVR